MKSRSFLLSDSKESRANLNTSLLSSVDSQAIADLMARYSCLEPTLEGEIIALLAAAYGESGAHPPARNTHMLMGRIGLITGATMTYGDLARKFSTSPTTARATCRSGMELIAQASLLRLLPVMPRLDAFQARMQLDTDADILRSRATLPELIARDGRLPIVLVALFGWDVLRWKLPTSFRRHFLSADLLPSPQAVFAAPAIKNGTASFLGHAASASS